MSSCACVCLAGGNVDGLLVIDAQVCEWVAGGKVDGLSSTAPQPMVSGSCASANSASVPSNPASFAYWYAVLPVGPGTVDALPLSPLSPRGIVSARVCAGGVPVIDAEAFDPAAPVVTVPIAILFGGPGTVDALPLSPFGPRSDASHSVIVPL